MSKVTRPAKLFVWFVAWIVPGLMLPLGLGAMPIGPVVVWSLAGLLMFGLVRLHPPRGPEVLGIAFGVGVWGFVTAYFNRDSVPCPSSGYLIVRPGELSSSCGGVAPVPFLLGGLILTVGALVGAAIWTAALMAHDRRRSRLGDVGPEG